MQVAIRTLLTTGEVINGTLEVADNQPVMPTLQAHGIAARRKDPRVAKVDAVGRMIGWMGHATDEHLRAIAKDEREQVAAGNNVDGSAAKA